MAEQAKRRGRAQAAGEPTFGQALAEVERILARLEAEETDIDDLASEVGRAVELIGICRRKLAATETQVRDHVDALQAEAVAPEADPAPGGAEGPGALPF